MKLDIQRWIVLGYQKGKLRRLVLESPYLTNPDAVCHASTLRGFSRVTRVRRLAPRRQP